jgi:hypothetical protein
MDLTWLVTVRNAIAACVKLRPLADYLYGRIAWFALLDEKRQRERINNDGHRIVVLQAHAKFCQLLAKVMKETGSTPAQINEVMHDLLIVRVREYLLAAAIAEAQLQMAATQVPLPVAESGGQSRRRIERRCGQSPSAGATRRNRVDDAGPR